MSWCTAGWESVLFTRAALIRRKTYPIAFCGQQARLLRADADIMMLITSHDKGKALYDCLEMPRCYVSAAKRYAERIWLRLGARST